MIFKELSHLNQKPTYADRKTEAQSGSHLPKSSAPGQKPLAVP